MTLKVFAPDKPMNTSAPLMTSLKFAGKFVGISGLGKLAFTGVQIRPGGDQRAFAVATNDIHGAKLHQHIFTGGTCGANAAENNFKVGGVFAGDF